jgi:hypothetical protein
MTLSLPESKPASMHLSNLSMPEINLHAPGRGGLSIQIHVFTKKIRSGTLLFVMKIHGGAYVGIV